MEIQKLIEKANRLLIEARYTRARIYTYNWLRKKGILKYMEQRGLVEFNEEMGEECMHSFHDGGTVTVHHLNLIKSVDVLINVLLYENLGSRLRKPVIHPFRERIGTKFGASPPSFTAENPVVFSEHHHPKTLKTL